MNVDSLSKMKGRCSDIGCIIIPNDDKEGGGQVSSNLDVPDRNGSDMGLPAAGNAK
jgi:hypothetical protein